MTTKTTQLTEIMMLWFVLLSFTVLSNSNAFPLQEIISHPDISRREAESFCETESFNASCDPGHVILMTHARYGRMHISRCAKINYGHIGCEAQVLELADTRCSGRTSCEIAIPDALFAQTKPCPEDLKPYLEAEYVCAPVHTPTEENSCTGTTITIPALPAATGLTGAAKIRYLANSVTEMTGCGGLPNPWTLIAPAGQRIHLILYDFNVAKARPDSYIHPRCPLYAVIREAVMSGEGIHGGDAVYQTIPEEVGRSRNVKKVSICGGQIREKSVYTSTSNVVEVGMARTDDVEDGPYFMLKYEVVGCADMAPLQGAWLVRNGDKMVVKCNNTRVVYNLKCVNNRWTGPHNCTVGTGTALVETTTSEKIAEQVEGLSISYGSSVMVILVTALTIGLLVLTAGLIVISRRKFLCPTGSSREGGSDSRNTDLKCRRHGSSNCDNSYATSCAYNSSANPFTDITPSRKPNSSDTWNNGCLFAFDQTAESLALRPLNPRRHTSGNDEKTASRATCVPYFSSYPRSKFAGSLQTTSRTLANGGGRRGCCYNCNLSVGPSCECDRIATTKCLPPLYSPCGDSVVQDERLATETVCTDALPEGNAASRSVCFDVAKQTGNNAACVIHSVTNNMTSPDCFANNNENSEHRKNAKNSGSDFVANCAIPVPQTDDVKLLRSKNGFHLPDAVTPLKRCSDVHLQSLGGETALSDKLTETDSLLRHFADTNRNNKNRDNGCSKSRESRHVTSRSFYSSDCT